MSRLSHELQRLAVLCQTGQPWQELSEQYRTPALSAWIEAARQTPEPQKMLRNLAGHCLLSERLRNQARLALLYPRLLVLILALLLVMLAWTTPQLAEQIMQMDGRHVPPGMSWMLAWPARLLASVVILAGGLWIYAGGSQSRRLGSWLSLRMRGRAEQALWCNCLRHFLAAGLDLPSALKVAAEGLEHPELGRQAQALSQGVSAGSSLSSLLENSCFDFMVVAGVQAGEDREDLASALADTCETMNAQLQQEIENLVSMIQPSAMVLVGLIVLLVQLAFWLSYSSFTQFIVD
ncbi:type II secretion system F family protein [bacterium]|nr:type II secretion system F family protein [bacterium]